MRIGVSLGVLGVLYWCMLTGAALGATVGFEAEAVEQTEIAFDGEYLSVGDEKTDVSYDPDERDGSFDIDGLEAVEDLGERLPSSDAVDDMVHRMVESVYNMGMFTTAVSADFVATWIFENQSWVSEDWFLTVILGAAAAPFVLVALKIIDTVLT